MKKIKLVECPRDAMQGIHDFIPTDIKVKYINELLKVGYDTIDFGSFVSPKAIPQLQDTADVLTKLDLSHTSTKLLAIIANLRGGEMASNFDQISYLGFPFSISETFQQRNTNSNIETSLQTVEQLQNLCLKSNKQLVVYISMAFGNPYGDLWSEEVALKWVDKIASLGVGIIAMSDTVGVARPADISAIFKHLIPAMPNVEFGAHLHCTLENWESKVDAAFQAGCRRFDSAIKGYGGCPMAEDELVGNLATENLLVYIKKKDISTGINMDAFSSSMLISNEVFV
jgi:hydroxymethylglutaryl-CoA lyase